MSEQQGRRLSARTVLAVLHGLKRQVREGQPLEPLTDIANRIVADLAGACSSAAELGVANQPGLAAAVGTAGASRSSNSARSHATSSFAIRWPPLDCALAEAAFALFLACHYAAEGQQGRASQEAPAAGHGREALQEGARANMCSLCDQKQPLTPAVCERLLEAFMGDSRLEQWAASTFTRKSMEMVEQLGLGGGYAGSSGSASVYLRLCNVSLVAAASTTAGVCCCSYRASGVQTYACHVCGNLVYNDSPQPLDGDLPATHHFLDLDIYQWPFVFPAV